MVRSILLYRHGALGDTLLALGALDALRARFPGASLTLAARPAYAAPLKDAGRTDALLDAGAPPFHLLYAEPAEGDELSLLLGRFDALALFARDPEGRGAARLAGRAGGRALIAPPFPPPEAAGHTAAWMIRALAPLGVPPPVEDAAPPAPLAPSPPSREAAEAILRRRGITPGFLAVHPGSGGAAKRAPARAMAEVCREYGSSAGVGPILIEGPADAPACGAFEKEWGEALPRLRTGRLEILAALLARAGAFVGNDSGVSHLAALCGTPALALFGPASEPACWAPLGGRSGWIPWERAGEGAALLVRLARKRLL